MFELKFNVTQLQELLDVGKLTNVFINPCNLSAILQQVSLQLPAGLSMLTGLTDEEMPQPRYIMSPPPRILGYLLTYH